MNISAKAHKVFWIALITALLSFWMENRLPDASDIRPELRQAPEQTPVTMPVFSVKAGALTYRVRPLYAYRLHGLIVSAHNSASWDDYYHAQWQDRINTKDIAVIWGPNVKDNIYRNFNFRSGSWTAYFQPRPGVSPAVWSRFDHASFSNNHLVTDDPLINKKILDLRPGDQVRLEGYLVNYGKDDRVDDRATSTVRTDMGCEVIFVKKIEILARANSAWRLLSRASLALTLISLIVGLVFWGLDLQRRKLALARE